MTTLDRRQALKVIASLGTAGLLAPVLSGCGPTTNSSARGPVNIGLIVPQSGPLQRIGDEMTTGFQVYLDDHDQTLGGLPVAVTTIDEGATASTGLAGVTAALSTNSLTVLVGVASSAVLAAIAANVEQSQIPLLASGSSPATLHIPYKHIWRTSYVAGEAGTAMATYLGGLGKLQRMIVVDDGSTDAQSEAKSFILAMPEATTTYQRITTRKVTADQLAEIVAYEPTGVFAACAGQSAIDFVAAYHRYPVRTPLYGPAMLTEGSVVAGALLDEESESALNLYTTNNYAPDLDNPENREFSAAYSSAKQPSAAPTTFAMTTYDAAYVLDIAIGNISGEVTPAAIASALHIQTQYNSPRGEWEFNDQATPRQRWYLRQVRADGLALQNSLVQAVDMLN